MEVSGAGEEADCDLEVLLTDLTCTLSPGDGRMLSVSMGLLAQAVVWERRSLELLPDLYGVSCELTPEFQPCTFHSLLERGTRRQTPREIIETGTMAKLVSDASEYWAGDPDQGGRPAYPHRRGHAYGGVYRRGQ